MNPRRSVPVHKPIRLSAFAQQGLFQSLNDENLRPNLIINSALIDKGQMLNHMTSAQNNESFDRHPPSAKQQIRSVKELKCSTVSVLNQLFTQRNSINGHGELSIQAIKVALERKNLEVQFFRRELQKLRDQSKHQGSQRQKLEQQRKRSLELEKQKEILLERITRLEQEFEYFQAQFGGSRTNLPLNSFNQGEEREMEISRLKKIEIQLRNEMIYHREKAIGLQKQLQSCHQVASKFQSYRCQVILEIGLLTNINQTLNAQNSKLKQSLNKPQGGLDQAHMEITQIAIQGEKSMMTSQLSTAIQELEEKSHLLAQCQNQLIASRSAQTTAQIDRQNIIVRMEEDLRGTLLTIDILKKQNEDLRNSLKNLNYKTQQSQRSSMEGDRLLKIARQLEEVRGSFAEKQNTIKCLRNELEKINEERKSDTNDYNRISSETELIKAEIILSNLRSQNEQLRYRNQSLQSANQDLLLKRSQTSLHELHQKSMNEYKTSDLSIRLETQLKQREKILTQLQSSNNQQKKLCLKVQNYQKQLMAFKKMEQNATNELTNLQKQLEKCKVQYLNVTQKARGLQIQIREVQSEKKSSVQSIEIRYKQELKQKCVELDFTQAQFTRTQKILVSTLQSLRLKESEIYSYQRPKQIEEMLMQIGKLEDQNTLLRQKLNTWGQSDQRLTNLGQSQRMFSNIESKLRNIIKLETNIKDSWLINRQSLLNKLVAGLEEAQIILRNGQRLCDQYETDLEALQAQNQNITFQKNHVIKQMQNLISRLKALQSHSKYLGEMAQSAQSQSQRLKMVNGNLKMRLQKQISEKQWLQNKIRGGIDDQVGDGLSKTKSQRLEVYTKMKKLMDTN